MRIFVVGAGGALGSAVLRALGGQGDTVTALVPTAYAHRLRGTNRLRILAGNIGAPGPWQAKVAQHDVLVDLRASLTPLASQTRLSRGILGDHQLVADALSRSGAIRRVVFMSMLGADDPSPLSLIKWLQAGEDVVRQSGLEYAMLRPSWIYCADDRAVLSFKRAVRLLPRMPMVGDPQAQVQPVALANIVEGIAKAVRIPLAASKAYNIGGPSIYTVQQIIGAIAHVAGKPGFRPRYVSPEAGQRLKWLPFAHLVPPAVTGRVCNPIAYYRDFCVRPLPFSEQANLSYLRRLDDTREGAWPSTRIDGTKEW